MVNILAHWFSVLFLAPFPAYFPSFCALPTRLNYSVALLISTWFYQEHVKSYSFQSSVFGARIGRRFFFGGGGGTSGIGLQNTSIIIMKKKSYFLQLWWEQNKSSSHGYWQMFPLWLLLPKFYNILYLNWGKRGFVFDCICLVHPGNKQAKIKLAKMNVNL